MSDVKAVHNYLTVGNQIGYSTIMQDASVTVNTRGLIMKAPVVSDNKVLVHTEDGVLYVLGRLNNAEIADLNDVLQKVGNVTKIVTLIDNVEQANNSVQTSSFTAPVVNNAQQPDVQTPVAIDPDASGQNNNVIQQ
jgi:hypothetical protein